MPMPKTVQKIFGMIGVELRETNASTSHTLLNNVQSYLRQIQKFADLPESAPALIREFETRVHTLEVGLRQFGDGGGISNSPVEIFRRDAFDAADRLGLVLSDATPSETSRALGID